MDNVSAIKSEAVPAENKNLIGKEGSDTKEITIEGLADRLQKMEEKMDLLISLINTNNEASVSLNAETKEPCKKKAKIDAKTQTKESSSDDSSEESDENKNDTRGRGPRGRGRGRGSGRGPRGLNVGGPYGGGRCGGYGYCSLC